MLNILHILGNEPHESVRRNVHDESVFLLRHNVCVMIAYDPSSRSAIETDFLQSLRASGALTYKLPYLRGSNGKTGGKGRLSLPSAALTLREMCIEYSVDVIHTHSEPAYALACAARFLGASAVHISTVHAVTERNAPNRLFGRLSVPWCDEYIAVDGYTAGVLLERKIRAGKIKRVNYGVDLIKWRKAESQEPAKADDIFTMVMIADGDPAGNGAAYDFFADMILRLMHDFSPDPSGCKAIKFIIAANSDFGLRYAGELINTLDLNDNVKTTGIYSYGAPAEEEGAEGEGGNGREAKKPAWTEIGVGNWVEAEAKIKLRSFKYGTGSKISDEYFYGGGARIEHSGSGGAKELFGPDSELSRRALYDSADICLYYSENRFFPYPAAEAAAMGIPVITNDMNIFAANAGVGAWDFAFFEREDAGGLTERVLALIGDGSMLEGLAAAEGQYVRSKYDIDDMIIGVYDSYVRGLRA